MSRNVRDVAVRKLKESVELVTEDFQCSECAAHLARGMDYRIVKSRNFIRMSRRIQTKSRTLGNSYKKYF